MLKLQRTIGATYLVRELDPELRTKGGVIVPQTVVNKDEKWARIGHVVGKGDKCEEPIEVGDHVLFDRFTRKQKFSGVELRIVPESEIFTLVDFEEGDAARCPECKEAK